MKSSSFGMARSLPEGKKVAFVDYRNDGSETFPTLAAALAKHPDLDDVMIWVGDRWERHVVHK